MEKAFCKLFITSLRLRVGGYRGFKADLTRLILVYFIMSNNLETVFSVFLVV